MPKQIFEISEFAGIDISVSSEDSSQQSGFDVLNIDNERALGNLTPIKDDTFLSRGGFTETPTAIGIDDDVYVIAMETLTWHNKETNKEEVDLITISAGNPFDESLSPSIDAILNIYSNDIDDLNLAGSDNAIPDTVTVPDGAGSSTTIDNAGDSSLSLTAGRTDLAMSQHTASISKWNQSLHIGTGSSSADKTKWVGRMKHGFLDIYRDDSGERHPDYDQLGCLDANVLPPQFMNLTKVVTDCDIDPANSASDATTVGRYAYGITEGANYVYKYDTMAGNQGGSMDSWKLVKRSGFYGGITSICYDPNGTQANAKWPDLHTDTSLGVIIITVKSTSGIGEWGGQIVILSTDLIEYGRYNINYPTDRRHDDGMEERWLGINQPETGDFSRFQAYKNSRGFGIGDILVTAPNDNTSRTLWISIWGPHKISCSDNHFGDHYEDASMSAGSNVWLEGSFRVLWKFNLASAWPSTDGLLMENASPPCHANRPGDDASGDYADNGNSWDDVDKYDERTGVWTHPGYYFVPKNALFPTKNKDWVGLVCKVAHKQADKFIVGGTTNDNETIYDDNKPVRKEHWEDFNISIIDTPSLFTPTENLSHTVIGEVLHPLPLNTWNGNGGYDGISNLDPNAAAKVIRYFSDIVIVAHRLRDLRNGNITIGAGGLDAEQYGIVWDTTIPDAGNGEGGGVPTWKSWSSHQQGGEHAGNKFIDEETGGRIRLGMCNNVNSFRFGGNGAQTDGSTGSVDPSGEYSTGHLFNGAGGIAGSTTIQETTCISDTVGIIKLTKGDFNSNKIAPEVADGASETLNHGAQFTVFTGSHNADTGDSAYTAGFYTGADNMERMKYPVISTAVSRSSSSKHFLYCTTENPEEGKANLFPFQLPDPQSDEGFDKNGYIGSVTTNTEGLRESFCAHTAARLYSKFCVFDMTNKPLIWPLVLNNSGVTGQFADVFQWVIAGKGESKAYKGFQNEHLTTFQADEDELGFDINNTNYRSYDGASYMLLHQGDSLIQSGTDVVTLNLSLNNDSGWVTEEGKYRYKISSILDGYQESALGTPVDIIIDNKSSVKIDLILQCFNEDYTCYNNRLSGYDIYRANIAEDGSQITEYQLAHTIIFSKDEGSKFQETASGQTTYYRRWALTDYGTAGAGFGAMTGLPETLNNTGLNYRLSTTIGSYHFVGAAYIQETGEEARNGIFRSKPAKFDVFDWSNDWLLLPDEPMAIQGFLGRLYAFSTKETFVIDPNTMQILDTFPGGAFGPRSVAVSEEYGMLYVNKSGAYLHNGSRSILVSEKVSEDHESDIDGRTNTLAKKWAVVDDLASGNRWGDTVFERFRIPQVYWLAKKDCFLINFGYRSSSNGYNGAFIYTPKTAKWTRNFTNYMQTACDGDKDDFLYISGKGNGNTVVAVRQMQESTAYLNNNNLWLSQKLTMGMPTTEKVFTKFKLAGNFEETIPSFIIWTDKGQFSSSNVEFVSSESTDKLRVFKLKGSIRTGRWIRVQLGHHVNGQINQKAHIESMSITYRPKKRA